MSSPAPAPAFFGGAEGGGSNTRVVVLSPSGAILGRADGPGSNGWLIGIPASASVLLDLFARAKAAAGVPASTPLAALGFCGSGFLQAGQQAALIAELRARDPALARHYYVDNDSPGSIYTASGGAGGMVIIAGTGSMGQVMAPGTGATANCGGWGHMFGDEGSAYSIASAAIRGIFQGLDGYTEAFAAGAGAAPAAPPSVAAAHRLMLEHFGVADKDGMLDVFYKSFDKARVAGFARIVAGAAAAGDAFCMRILAGAGTQLGCVARALAARLRATADGAAAAAAAAAPVRIVCVGSVWRSFALFRDAFVAAATARDGGSPDAPPLAAFELVQLTETSALGAAWRAAQLADTAAAEPPAAPSLTLPHADYVSVLYAHPPAA